MQESDKVRFARFIPDFRSKTERSLEDAFRDLSSARLLITEDGISRTDGRIHDLCGQRFSKCYPRIIPFPFEGFHNKSNSAAKKLLAQIAKNLLTGKMDYQSVQAQNRDFRNRVEGVLVVKRPNSWGILTEDIHLTYPENESVRSIFQDIDRLLENADSISIGRIFAQYLLPPYGLNELSLGLLLACYIAYKGPCLKIRYQNEVVKTIEWATNAYLERGIDFRILENTELVKVDADLYLAKYNQICDRIEQCSDILQVRELRTELDRLLQEQEIPETLTYRIKMCEMKLQEGTDLELKVSRSLEAQHDALNAAIENADFRKFLTVISYCQGKSGYIEGSTHFRYNKNQIEEYDELTQTARKHIENDFEDWLNHLRCDSVSQVGSFEGYVRGIIKQLNDLGYEQFARKTRSKLESIVDDMKHIRILQTIREQIETFLRECAPNETSTYDQLAAWRHKGQELEEFVNNHGSLSKTEVEDYKAKIRSKLNAVENSFQQLRDQITSAFNLADNLSSIEDCHTLIDRIRAIINRNIRDIDRESLIGLASITQRFLTELEQLNYGAIGRREAKNFIESLHPKWNEQDVEVDFSAVLLEYWAKLEAMFDDHDRRWVARMLSFEVESVRSWDVNQCLNWKKEVELLPNYLRPETLNLVEDRKGVVNRRLDELNVEAVVAMYSRLTIDQKRVCIKRLQECLRLELGGTNWTEGEVAG